jgi:hypothetical protein
VRAQEELAQLRYHWGDVYVFGVANGCYTATAKFGQLDMLEARDLAELLRKVRRHYRSDMLHERCSTWPPSSTGPKGHMSRTSTPDPAAHPLS